VCSNNNIVIINNNRNNLLNLLLTITYLHLRNSGLRNPSRNSHGFFRATVHRSDSWVMRCMPERWHATVNHGFEPIPCNPNAIPQKSRALLFLVVYSSTPLFSRLSSAELYDVLWIIKLEVYGKKQRSKWDNVPMFDWSIWEVQQGLKFTVTNNSVVLVCERTIQTRATAACRRS
jgi:hypothetical protein